MKSSLVAQEFASGIDREVFFAATLPLMACKFVPSAPRGKIGIERD